MICLKSNWNGVTNFSFKQQTKWFSLRISLPTPPTPICQNNRETGRLSDITTFLRLWFTLFYQDGVFAVKTLQNIPENEKSGFNAIPMECK